MRLIQRMAGWLAPPVCTLCGGTGQWLEEPWGLDLCAHCEAACPRAPDEPDLPAFCLFRYADPVDHMIQRLKFHQEIAFARVLGTLFARAWQVAALPLPECVIPMPLHRSRYRERGFCQTTLLAGHIAHRLRRPDGRRLPVCPDLLRRTRATRPQSGLTAQARRTNLRGAFQCPTPARLPHHVALLDDVLTTGNTSGAAIEALRGAGIARVDLWCVARALRQDDCHSASDAARAEQENPAPGVSGDWPSTRPPSRQTAH